MLRLNLTGAPETVALPHGAALECRPMDIDLIREAMADLAAREDDAGEDGAEGGGRVVLNDVVVAVGCRMITGWSGIEGVDGIEVPFDAALTPVLLRDPVVFRCFHEQYGMRALGLVNEGNDLAPLPNGISAEGADTAPAAPAAAPNAPMTSMPPAPSKG